MLSGTLYIISISIGDLKDLSLHAKETLARLHTLACEDTRDTSSLLKELGIAPTKELISFFEHNERKRVEAILKLLEGGEDVGLISSRGTPLISDPGYVLVREVIRKGMQVKVIPGPTALIAALLLSGLPSDKFIFLGFPPRKSGEQKRFFEKFGGLKITLIFYESPRRLEKTLMNLRELFCDWKIAICRELTKPHEEVIRGNFDEVLNGLKEKKILGEITVVLSMGKSTEEKKST